jgi:hypothetical protein
MRRADPEGDMNAAAVLQFSAMALLLLPPIAGAAEKASPAKTGQANDQAAAVEFTENVQTYAELHRLLAAPLGPEQMCSDPEEFRRGTATLAAAIREARAAARSGDIFSTRVAPFFRTTLAGAARAWYDVPRLLEEMDEEGLATVVELEVNGNFPWDAGVMMPPRLLLVLPALPEELEYRFVGADLVLLDVRANLIVDLLENALSAPPPPAGETEYGPCDVHPDMPGCWM